MNLHRHCKSIIVNVSGKALDKICYEHFWRSSESPANALAAGVAATQPRARIAAEGYRPVRCSNLTWTLFKSNSFCHRAKCLYRCKCERAIQRNAKFHSQKCLDAVEQSNMDRLPIQCAPHACREPPAGGQDSRDLPHGRTPIREKLQSLLAEHHVKAAVQKGHFECVALLPLDIRYPAGGAYHCFVDIQPDNRAELASHRPDASGNHARAASQIENAITISHLARDD